MSPINNYYFNFFGFDFFTSIHFAYYIITLCSGFELVFPYAHPTPLSLEPGLKGSVSEFITLFSHIFGLHICMKYMSGGVAKSWYFGSKFNFTE